MLARLLSYLSESHLRHLSTESQNTFCGRHIDLLERITLLRDLLNLSILDHDSASIRSPISKIWRGVEEETKLFCEVALWVSKESDTRRFAWIERLIPCVYSEGIVYSDNVDWC